MKRKPDYYTFMAGWNEGYPAEESTSTPSHIDRNSPDFHTGVRAGQRMSRRDQQRNPEWFENGVLKADEE